MSTIRKLIAHALTLLLLLAPAPVLAMQALDLTPVGSQDRFTFEASAGLLTVAADELVAPSPGMAAEYLSKLEWRPVSWLRLGLGAWKDSVKRTPRTSPHRGY